MYRNAKRKLSEFDPGNSALKPGSGAGGGVTPGGTPASTPKKRTPSKRKNDNGDGEEGSSPSKAKRERKMDASGGPVDSVGDG